MSNTANNSRNATDEDDNVVPLRPRARRDQFTPYIEFLMRLRRRPCGEDEARPMLIAIDPNDGRIEARTLSGGREINAFVAKWNGERNIYYAANPTRGKLDKKAEKEDVYAIEYLLSDLDPVDDESPEEAKARYLKQLESFTARPTMLMDSGNGLQALWQLKTPIALEAPIQLDPIKVKGKRKPITSQFSAEDQAKIDDAEARSAALMRRLGAPTGTQNIDRILRLPETINLPSKAKKAKGRVTCYTRLLWFEWSKYSLEDFPRDQEAPQKARDKRNGAAGSHHMKLPGGIADAYELDDTGNGHGFRFMRRQRHKGMDYEQAKAAILADEGRAGEWANRVDERQLERAYERAFLYDKDEDSDSGSELKHRLLQTSAEFVANFVPPDYLIDGWLQRRFVYSFTAPTGSGKTAIALLIAAHVALGLPLAGREVEKGRVLFFAGENPDDVRSRWLKLCEEIGLDPDTKDVVFMPFTPNLSKKAIRERIDAEAAELGPFALLIVDTSASYYTGDDENDNVALGNHARLLRSFVDLAGGPTILVTCHPTKTPDMTNLLPRGGGAFLAEVDGNLVCVLARSSMVVEVTTHGKFRGPEFTPFTFKLKQGTSAKLVDRKGTQSLDCDCQRHLG